MPDTTVNANDGKRPLRVCCITFGCQMNTYDTEVAEGMMQQAGFEVVSEYGGNGVTEKKQDSDTPIPRNPDTSNVDVVLLNTCSVREHAEDRVYGRLGMFGKAKKENPNLVIGLMGCMVEEHKEKLFKRFPQLDLMVGTRNIKDLPALVEDVLTNRRQVSKIKRDGISIEYTDQIKRSATTKADKRGTFHAWLPIMTGCNKVCTFCMVPITRGPEVSMPARDVYREASRLVEEGVKWITLLGQNVNSYEGRWKVEGGGWKEEQKVVPSTFDLPPSTSKFPELLSMLCQIQGLEALSFTTSHPQDATEELYRVIARNPKISRRFHLPIQSGSSRILKRMKRLHTYEEYREKIYRMRAVIPDVSITTDIIVGFCGETEEDYRQTARALEGLRFDGAYIYKYSVRPGTPAAKLEDDVPQEVKEARNAELLRIQNQIRDENYRAYLGKTMDVFAESVNPKNSCQLMGRSREEKRVVFDGDPSMIGKFYRIKIDSLKNETFFGHAFHFLLPNAGT